MKIEHSRPENKSVSINDIKAGECFLYGDNYLMKIDSNNRYNAINLALGTLHNISLMASLKPITIVGHVSD